MAPRTALLLCLIAATGSAFAVQEPPPAFTARKVALDMSSGGGESVPELKPPAALYQGAVAAGAAKASAPFSKIFNLGVVSGAHIGFGIWLAVSVGGACPGIAADNPGLQKIIMGAFGLPFGLIMTLVTGGELFTGNTALVTGAYMEGKIEKKALVKSWVASYLGNFVGSLIIAYLAFKSGTLGSGPGAVNIASTFLAISLVFFFSSFLLTLVFNNSLHSGQMLSRMGRGVHAWHSLQLARLHGCLHGFGMFQYDWKNDGRLVPH